jgi:hypothetical protein
MYHHGREILLIYQDSRLLEPRPHPDVSSSDDHVARRAVRKELSKEQVVEQISELLVRGLGVE